MPFECKSKVKFFITTKADLATDKVNKWLEANYDGIDVLRITPFMSYTGERGYMIGCMIEYLERNMVEINIPETLSPNMTWKEE